MSGDLVIERETVLVELPRGEREVLRVSWTLAKTPEGKMVSWHSLRVFYRAEDKTMKPGRAGVTIRPKELEAVLRALVDDFRIQRGHDAGAPNRAHARGGDGR